MTPESFERLLQGTKEIVLKHLEIEKLKGEKFNIFSILKMEYRENATHSAFIKELLDPDGSHLMGNIFLRSFLEILDNRDIDVSIAKVKTEHSIGECNDLEKTGGRIDIFIWDDNASISIENKINASDQYLQIERYCNHNKNKNKVYYLTLLGKEPHDESKGALVAGEDFYIISYKKQIIEWLEKCLQQSLNASILKESINQYLILIKKITNTMDDSKTNELNKLMLEFFNESNHIASNFIDLKAKIGREVRSEVKDMLEKRIGGNFNIYWGNDVYNESSQLWIKFKEHNNAKLYFGVESFSFEGGPGLDVGILNEEKNETKYFHMNSFKATDNLWPYCITIDNFEEFDYDFDKQAMLYKLYNDLDFRNRFVSHIVNEVEKFILVHKQGLFDFLNAQDTIF